MAALVCIAVLLAPLGHAADSLSFWKNYFVTGDYAVAGVGLRGTGQSGWATGTLNMTGVPCTGGPGAFSTEPCSTKGAIASDIVAAFLYWETEESTQLGSASGYFDGNAITGTALGGASNPSCDGSNGNPGPSGSYGHVYRADVLPFLQIDTVNSVHLANGTHTVKFADSGKSGTLPNTNGATLVVVYKVVVPGNPGIFPLKSVVFYDGSYTLAKGTAAFTQTVGGFYQATGFGATMAQIVANGQPGFDENLTVNGSSLQNGFLNNGPFDGSAGVRWDNPAFNINLAPNASSYSTEATLQSNSNVCLTWAAVVTSTPVVDSDSDGLLDTWETKGIHLNTTTTPATFGGCADYPTDPCVDLPAMGANPYQRDIFLQIDWMHGVTGSGGLDGLGTHDHKPTQNALNMVCQEFALHLIALHFDVGNNYQGQPCIVPYKTDQWGHQITAGGNDESESQWVCQNTATVTCTYSAQLNPYAILSFKRGFQDVRDGDPLLNLNGLFPTNRKDSFHYVLFTHALSGPFSTTGVPLTPEPSSVSGIADRPGGDLMVTLGLWRTDVPTTDMVGTDLIQAGTLMHELGHNLDLSHYGLYRTPNCAPEYASVMNYMYQTRGLTDAQGNEHIDYSYGLIFPPLSENNPTPILFPLLYRVRYYAPWNSNTDTQGQIAQTFCDGSTITNGARSIRLESAGLAAPDWTNGTGEKSSPPLDLNFDGIYGQTFNDQPDWFSLNLQQVGGRPNAGSASVDVGFSDAGFSDAGFSDAGFSDAGFSDAGFSDAGFSDAGVTDGDIDLNTEISSGAPAPGALAVSNTINSNQLTWTPPSAGQVVNYNVYRCAVISPATTCTFANTPFATAPGGTSTPSFADTVNNTTSSGEGGSTVCSTSTCYNTTYDYKVTAVLSTTVNNIPSTSESLPTNSVSSEITHLFVIAGGASVVYGNTIPAPTFTVYGDVSSSLSASSVSCVYSPASPHNAATYSIVCSGPATTSATDGVTYNAAYLTYTPGTLVITPRPITVTAAASTKVYDGGITSPATPTITTGTLAYTDTPNFIETYDNKNVGTTHVMTPSGTVNDGNGGNNYKVTFVTISTGIITPKPLAIAVTGSRTYGGTSVVYTPVYNGFVSGDTVANSLTGTLVCTATATASSPAGNYAVASCSGLSALNYSIGYTYGTYTVNPAPLVVSVTGSQTYGQANQSFMVVGYATLVNGDTAAAIGGTLVCSAPTNLNANVYVNVAACSGLTDANYSISYASTFTVLKAVAQVTLSNMTQPYTGSPLSPTATTVPSGLNVIFTGAPDTAVGQYPVTATVNDPNYTGSATGTFTIQISGFTNFALNGVTGGVPTLLSSGTQLELANNLGDEASSGWYPNELNVAAGFSTTFTFQISPGFNGNRNIADGLAFVIQAGNGTTALGAGGGGIGYDGIPNSIAIEFDTYQNTTNNDPFNPHIGIQSNGTAPNSADHGSSADLSGGPIVAIFADGNPHTAVITYDGSATLNVYLDGATTPIASASVNLATLLALDGSTNAWVGFTGGTGALEEFTTVLSWTWTPGPPVQP